jgi:hypothetical protein
MGARRGPGQTPGAPQTDPATDDHRHGTTNEKRSQDLGGNDDVLADIRFHVLACDEWTPNLGLPPLSDQERDQVHARIDELAAERLGRADAHRDQLARAALHLGRQVGAHLMVLTDAERRLEQLVGIFDPETSVPLTLVDCDEAAGIVGVFFADGMTGAS